MGKKLRKADRRLLRQQKSSEQFLKEKLKLNKVDSLPLQSSSIPQSAPINPSIDELLENHIDKENFKLIFVTYNHKQCELCRLNDSKKTKKLIEVFNRITKCTPKLLPSSGIVKDNINNSGKYKFLYDTVPPDTELKEAEFSDEGRLFFYIYQNYFCIVAIKSRHI